MRGSIVPVLAAAVLLAGCVTTAGSGPSVESPTVGEFAGLLQQYGHTTRVTASGSGAPVIEVNEGGDNFAVSFYDCAGTGGIAARRCTGVEYHVSYPVKRKPTLSQINRMNSEYHMVKVYMTDDGDPGLSMAVNTGGGFTHAHARDSLDWWQTAMREFEDDVGWQ